MPTEQRVILIGGTSHCGKSTLGQFLASKLGWGYRSTDNGFAPHPGRPWQDKPLVVPPHVVEHYRTLTPEELLADVVRHYTEIVWPLVESFVASHATDHRVERVVLEGSALLPELVAQLKVEHTSAIWLTANYPLFEQRIYHSSKYDTKTPEEKYLIDQFLARTWLFDQRMRESLQQFGLDCIDIEETRDVEDLANKSLRMLQT